MKKWQIPTLYDVKDAVDFFVQLIELNKSSKSFSQRALAKFLNWPVSYIPDITKKRKPFTVARSLEFITAFRINSIDAEQIIFLAINSQSNGELQQIKAIKDTRKPLSRTTIIDLDVFSFEVLLIFEIVRWFRGSATKESLKVILSRKKFDDVVVDKSINLLLKKKLVQKKEGGKLMATLDSIFSDEKLQTEQEIRLHQNFADNLKRFVGDRFKPATGSTTFIHLNISRFDEIKDKILSLRNWIQEVSANDSVKSPQRDTILFQLDLYLTPQFNQEDIVLSLAENSNS